MNILSTPDICLCIIGLYFMIFGWIVNAKDKASLFLFKLPLCISGAYCILYACINSGMIIVGQ